MSMVCDALTFAPKLFHDLISTMVGHMFSWLGTLFMLMIYDALSLRWVLPTYWTLFVYLSTNYSLVCLIVLFSGSQCRFNLLEPRDTRLEAFSLFMAERLQHVEAPTGETCVVCHDPKPIGPVRLSCQHLFCCGCAHLTFVRRDDCPLCLQKPLPIVCAQTSDHNNNIDSRLKRIYNCYLLQIPFMVFSNILALLPTLLSPFKSRYSHFISVLLTFRPRTALRCNTSQLSTAGT